MEKNKLNMFLFFPPISASALFLGCSYFSDHFEARCSYKVCSYKKKSVLHYMMHTMNEGFWA